MANNIAFYRIQHGLTQKEFGEKIGMATHAVGYAENHSCTVKLAKETAALLDENPFRILGTDVLKLIPQTEEDKEILIKMIKEIPTNGNQKN